VARSSPPQVLEEYSPAEPMGLLALDCGRNRIGPESDRPSDDHFWRRLIVGVTSTIEGAS
jgi:hypothetical protein